jgi:hypothetical protein
MQQASYNSAPAVPELFLHFKMSLTRCKEPKVLPTVEHGVECPLRVRWQLVQPLSRVVEFKFIPAFVRNVSQLQGIVCSEHAAATTATGQLEGKVQSEETELLT